MRGRDRGRSLRARGGRGDSNIFAELASSAARWAAEGKKLVLAAWTEGSRERLRHLLGEHGFPRAEKLAGWAGLVGLAADRPGLIVLGLERGFAADGVVVVAEQDLLGERISRPPRRRKSADELIAEASELAAGDLVVHQEYGIGRYDGLATLAVEQAPHDCLRLIYDGDEKLFLPVENIELLSRYGQADGAALDKLGGAGWQTRKARMQHRIRDIARELITLAAERQVREAPSLAPPEGTWEEFCARFPFAETEDQTRAIADVLEDLASGAADGSVDLRRCWIRARPRSRSGPRMSRRWRGCRLRWWCRRRCCAASIFGRSRRASRGWG